MTLPLFSSSRRETRAMRRTVRAYVRTVRATLPAFDVVEDDTLVKVGSALLVVAATDATLERLRDVFAIGSNFVRTADLAGLLVVANEHLRPLLFDGE